MDRRVLCEYLRGRAPGATRRENETRSARGIDFRMGRNWSDHSVLPDSSLHRSPTPVRTPRTAGKPTALGTRTRYRGGCLSFFPCCLGVSGCEGLCQKMALTENHLVGLGRTGFDKLCHCWDACRSGCSCRAGRSLVCNAVADDMGASAQTNGADR